MISENKKIVELEEIKGRAKTYNIRSTSLYKKNNSKMH